jgi:hypothetical protein
LSTIKTIITAEEEEYNEFRKNALKRKEFRKGKHFINSEGYTEALRLFNEKYGSKKGVAQE